jgi:hypothetical protein
MHDEWRCLQCDCTFDGGCKAEREAAENPKPLRRYIPPKRLVVPPQSSYRRNPEGSKAYAREKYRQRIEARGGTVRERSRS